MDMFPQTAKIRKRLWICSLDCKIDKDIQPIRSSQVDELLKVLKHLEQMTEQAGKPKENSFSLHRIRLPRLHLPHISIPALISLLMAAAALLLLWWGLGTVWSSSSLLPL